MAWPAGNQKCWERGKTGPGANVPTRTLREANGEWKQALTTCLLQEEKTRLSLQQKVKGRRKGEHPGASRRATRPASPHASSLWHRNPPKSGPGAGGGTVESPSMTPGVSASFRDLPSVCSGLLKPRTPHQFHVADRLTGRDP